MLWPPDYTLATLPSRRARAGNECGESFGAIVKRKPLATSPAGRGQIRALRVVPAVEEEGLQAARGRAAAGGRRYSGVQPSAHFALD